MTICREIIITSKDFFVVDYTNATNEIFNYDLFHISQQDNYYEIGFSFNCFSKIYRMKLLSLIKTATDVDNLLKSHLEDFDETLFEKNKYEFNNNNDIIISYSRLIK